MADDPTIRSGPDRLPPIPDEQMTFEQAAAVQEILAGPRGMVPAPYVPLMRSPGLMQSTQKMGEYLRFRSPLPENVKELAILVIAALWGQDYEWAFHLPLALKAGVGRDTAEALARGERPVTMSAEEEVAHDFLIELNAAKGVGDGLYRRAERVFGEQGVMDLVGFSGCYSLLAMVMNAARTPAPAAEIPLTSRR